MYPTSQNENLILFLFIYSFDCSKKQNKMAYGLHVNLEECIGLGAGLLFICFCCCFRQTYTYHRLKAKVFQGEVIFPKIKRRKT